MLAVFRRPGTARYAATRWAGCQLYELAQRTRGDGAMRMFWFSKHAMITFQTRALTKIKGGASISLSDIFESDVLESDVLEAA
jgi:hypothetical protein